jgi:Flp pilus assembly protein TadG
MALRARRLVREEEGAAVVEFALVMPILALVVFGIIDFGRAFYTVNNIISAVREGARYGAVLAEPGTESAERRIEDRVRNVSRPFGGDSLTNDHIDVEFDQDAGTIKVRVENYPFRPLTPIAGALGFDTWPITREATFRWERGI